MHREEHVLNEIHAYRYRGDDPKYAIVVSHGIASHGAIYDVFCCHHAQKGVDIWSTDAPGHGKSTTNRPRGQFTLEEWTEAVVDYAAHVKAETGLPVFTLGSSLGGAAAFSALYSDDISGAILMGTAAIPGGPMFSRVKPLWESEGVQGLIGVYGRALRLDCDILFDFDEDYGFKGAGEQKKMDPWNTWTYDMASWGSLFTYDPKIPADKNEKPILLAGGSEDPTFSPKILQLVADAIGGPIEYQNVDGASHQLMLFHTEDFSNRVQAWVEKTL